MTDNDQPKLRFLLVDDHPIVLAALGRLLADAFPQAQVTESGNFREATQFADTHPFDVAIIDLELGNIDGVELIKYLHHSNPDTIVLVLSLHTSATHAERSLRAGALGYVPKSEAATSIIRAIETVLRREIFLPPKIALDVAGLSARKTGGNPVKDDLHGLSDREIQIFNLLGHGYSLQKIADQLFLSVKTVETYRSRLKEKLGLKSAEDLREKAIQWKLSHKK